MKLPPILLPSLFVLATALATACGKRETVVIAPPTAAAQPGPQQVEEPPPPPAEDDRDCNLSTPLVPGIPGSPGHLIKSERNPNGDSELAVLMRLFVDDLRDLRPLLEAGQPVKKLHGTYRKMRCAWPTNPSERNEAYDARAVAFLGLVKAFDAAPGKDSYNGIIAGCIACHSQSCGGPIDFIDGMKWE